MVINIYLCVLGWIVAIFMLAKWVIGIKELRGCIGDSRDMVDLKIEKFENNSVGLIVRLEKEVSELNKRVIDGLWSQTGESLFLSPCVFNTSIDELRISSGASLDLLAKRTEILADYGVMPKLKMKAPKAVQNLLKNNEAVLELKDIVNSDNEDNDVVIEYHCGSTNIFYFDPKELIELGKTEKG